MAHGWTTDELKQLGEHLRDHLGNADKVPDHSSTPSLPGCYVTDDELKRVAQKFINETWPQLKGQYPGKFTFGQMMMLYGHGVHYDRIHGRWCLKDGNLHAWIKDGAGRKKKSAKIKKEPVTSTKPVDGSYDEIGGDIQSVRVKGSLMTTATSSPKKKIKMVRIYYYTVIFVMLVPVGLAVMRMIAE